MVTHTEIVSRNGSDADIAEKLGVRVHQVRDWRLRNSIPAERWAAFSERRLATLEELAKAASSKAA